MDNSNPNPSESIQLEAFDKLEAVAGTLTFGQYSRAHASPTYLAQIENGYVSSIAIDYSESQNFCVRAASVAGTRHRLGRRVRQDSFALAEPQEGLLVIAIGDGLGSLPYSHFAADFACQAVCSSLIDRIALPNRDLGVLQPEDVFSPVNDSLLKLRESLAIDLATTLVVAAMSIEKPEEACVWLARIGDSTAALLSLSPDGDNPLWQFVFGGEGTVQAGVATTKTSALPSQSLQCEHQLMPLHGDTNLFLLTDGLSIPLEISALVREGLGRLWLKPPSPLDFASHISFNRRGELDDRTAVGIWLKPWQP